MATSEHQPINTLRRLGRVQALLGEFISLQREDPRAAELLLGLITSGTDCRGFDPHDDLDDGGEHELSLWGSTHRDRILRLFVDRENEWLTIPDIRNVTGIGRGPIAQVVYSTHAQEFDRKPHPSHAKMRMWRLMPHVFEAFRHKEHTAQTDKQRHHCGDASMHSTTEEVCMVI